MISGSKNTVAVAFDDKYVLPFLVMIFSASKSRILDFHLKIAFDYSLLSETSRTTVSKILEKLQISFEFIPIRLDAKLRSHYHIGKISFARLYLADTLTEKFLWLDCDLICFQGWDQLFAFKEFDAGSSAVCAAVDTAPVLQNLNTDLNKKNAALSRVGNNYFNSGVLLVNPRIWRIVNEVESWIDVYSSFDELGFQFADQCMLNYLCFQSFSHLDSSYNLQTLSRQRKHRIALPKIIHYVGTQKPWHYRRNEMAIYFSNIKPEYIYRYLNLEEKLIIEIEGIDAQYGLILRIMQRNSRKQNMIKISSISRLLPNLLSLLKAIFKNPSGQKRYVWC
jgi:lipopolysaccharide biosynthesis glycosyltransferase